MEPQVVKRFNGDLNGYLKWDQLGKTNDASPHLITLLSVTKAAIAHKVGQQPSLRDMVTAVITG